MAEQGRIVMPTVGATGSRGGLTDNTVKLCNTSYRASYGFKTGPGRASFISYLRPPSGSGFTSNQRPAIYYRPSLDHTDNPQFGLLLSDSFVSQTQRHYQHHIQSDCLGSLPNLINKPRDSGFHQLRSRPKTAAVEEKTEYQRLFVPHQLTPTGCIHTCPVWFESSAVHLGRCEHSNRFRCTPKQPDRDLLEEVVPVQLKTNCGVVFFASLHHVTVGPKGESGFTEGTDLRLNTFQEKKSCWVEPLQTHSSVMKNDFVPPSSLKGTEASPSLSCSRFSRETGFTRGAIAPLACPTSPLPSPQTKSSAPTERTIGNKEPTGFLLNVLNSQAFPNTPFDCSHFTTQYRSTFCQNAAYEKLKSGPTCAGIICAKMDSGYNRRDMDRFIFRG